MKESIIQRITLFLLSITAVVFIALAVYGGIKNFLPVPIWDMWDGCIGFFLKVSNGDYSAWWAQHNEHRIFFSRILFWTDIRFFSGRGVFLVIMNYVLTLICYLLLIQVLSEILDKECDDLKNKKYMKRVLALVILTISFSWTQSDNFINGFQSCFFFSLILPFISFYFLYKSSISQKYSFSFFSIACIAGILSVGTMANGIITLPLLIVLSLLLKTRLSRIAILVILSITTVIIYFNNYTAANYHVSIFWQNTPELFKYTLTYLGIPFYYKKIANNLLIAQIAGSLLLICSLYFLYISLKTRPASYLHFTLLILLLFIGGTVVGTGQARVFLGINQALSSRYATPSLMAWSVILILFSPSITRFFYKKTYLVFLLLIIPSLLIPQQMKARNVPYAMYFEYKLGALALLLAPNDINQVFQVSGFTYTPPLIDFCQKNYISVYGTPLLKDIKNIIGTHEHHRSSIQVNGKLEGIIKIKDLNDYYKIEGWIYNPVSGTIPSRIHILDDKGIIIGYAITGKPRKDLKKLFGKKANLAGFKGYMLNPENKSYIFLRGFDPDCEVKVEISSFYTVKGDLIIK